MNKLTHTRKAVASVLPNEDRTLNSLLEYIGNDIRETLQLVRDQLDIINK